MRRRPSHPPELKARVALEALSDPDGLEEVAARHGLAVDTVRAWRDDLKARAPRLFRSPLSRLALRLWPASAGQRFSVGILAGVAIGLLWPGLVPLLEPIGLVGLQAAQLVVMPLLICEVLLALGRLGQGSLPGLLRLGGLWLGLLWLIGCLAVLVMPLMLPQLAGSPFFSPSLLNPRPSIDLVRSVVPANLFQALAADNVAAIVLVCGALGVLLHRLDDREDLLRPLAVLTRLFRDLNGIVLSVLPLSVMALTAGSVRQADAELLIRLQGLLAITLVGGLVVTGVLCGLLLALLPCGMGRIWRIVAGPLGVVLGSANLMAALPLLLANLRRELASCAWGGEQDRAQAEEAMTAAVALGFALPGLGQVMGLVCVPFLAWMRDQTLSLSDQLQVLLIGVPSVSGGLKLAVREGLRQQGLPLDLLTLIDVTGVWVYRFEKGMTLLGLLSLALVVYAGALRMLRFRPLPLLLALAAAGLPAGLGGSAVHAGLAASLRGRYRNDRLVLERQAMQSHPPVMLVSLPPPAPVSLREIRGRGVLRLGVRREAMPWAYRNHSGQWVGFDLDLLRRLSIDLGIGQIQLVEGSSQDLERWLEQGRLDLLAGGLLATPGRSARFMVSDPYFIAHLGLVVADAAVRRLQDLEARPMDRPLQLAVTDSNLVTLNLRDRIDQQLGGGLTGVRIAPIASRDAFFSPDGLRRFDGLLTTTEGGAAWSAVHPTTTMLAPFGSTLPVRLALLIGGSDQALSNYINGWLSSPDGQAALCDFNDYWILMRGARAGAGRDIARKIVR